MISKHGKEFASMAELRRFEATHKPANPSGHLDAWMRQTCDMNNEGDRLAWEQYQALIKAFMAEIDAFENHLSGQARDENLGSVKDLCPCFDNELAVAKAALKAAKGE